jgi:hypothetical protein
MKRNLSWLGLLLGGLLLGGWLAPSWGTAAEDPYNLEKLLPADNKIISWTKIGNLHTCAHNECLNDSLLAVSQAYPYFNRGAVAAVTQSYVHNQNKDGMEITVIRMRSFSHARVVYSELGLPAYWKGQNGNIVTMGRDNYVQGRMGRCQSDCRLEFAVGAYMVRLKYYGRTEREQAALLAFAGEIIKILEA